MSKRLIPKSPALMREAASKQKEVPADLKDVTVPQSVPVSVEHQANETRPVKIVIRPTVTEKRRTLFADFQEPGQEKDFELSL